MVDKKGKKEIDPEKEFEVLKEMFHAEHKYWRGLYSDHSVAHARARKAVREDTTGLLPKEIEEEFSKYVETYDETIRGKATGMKEYRKELARGEARTFLEQVAQQQRLTYSDFLDSLKREGLESVFAGYSSHVKTQDISGLTSSIINKYVNLEDEALMKGVAAALKKYDMRLKEKHENLILADLRHYLTTYMIEYHRSTAPKKKEK